GRADHRSRLAAVGACCDWLPAGRMEGAYPRRDSFRILAAGLFVSRALPRVLFSPPLFHSATSRAFTPHWYHQQHLVTHRLLENALAYSSSPLRCCPQPAVVFGEEVVLSRFTSRGLPDDLPGESLSRIDPDRRLSPGSY